MNLHSRLHQSTQTALPTHADGCVFKRNLSTRDESITLTVTLCPLFKSGLYPKVTSDEGLAKHSYRGSRLPAKE